MATNDSKNLNQAVNALKKSERRNTNLQNAVVKAAVLLKKKQPGIALARLNECIKENGLELLERLEKGVER